MYAKRHGVETQDLETDSDDPFVTGDDGFDVFLQNKNKEWATLSLSRIFL
jgi:hypothetical protein